MGDLTGKVAIVTGASRGIGRAIAEIFSREGASVVICGRKQDTLDQVAREIGGPGHVKAVACHVGRAEQIKNMLAIAAREFWPRRHPRKQRGHKYFARPLPRCRRSAVRQNDRD